MQIHELNTFTGVPGGTDFIPIDTGFDTAKISAPKLLEPIKDMADLLDQFKINTPKDIHHQPDYGVDGQLLRTKGDGSTEWVDEGLPSDAQTAQAVSDWLDAHPEATTTVQDGSLTEAKFSESLKLKAIKDYVTPEMYGAIGDGVTDDSIAISQSLAQDKPVFFGNKTYKMSQDELFCDCSAIIGDYTTILIANDMNRLFKLRKTKLITGFIFDCNNHGVNMCIRTDASEENAEKNIIVENIEVKNAYDLRANEGAGFITLYNNDNVVCRNIFVHDCKHIINGVITDPAGNITGINCHGYSTAHIENTKFVDIYNIDGQGVVTLEDGGGIFAGDRNSESVTFITNMYGYNFCKRLIKTQCAGYVFCNNIKAYSDSPDCLVAIGIQSRNEDYNTGRCSISNCDINLDFSYSNEFVGKMGIAVDTFGLITNCKINVLRGYGVYLKDAYVSNCIFNGDVGIAIIHGESHFSNCEIDTNILGYYPNSNSDTIIKFDSCKIKNALDAYTPAYNHRAKLMQFNNCDFSINYLMTLYHDIELINCNVVTTGAVCFSFIDGYKYEFNSVKFYGANTKYVNPSGAGPNSEVIYKNCHMDRKDGVSVIYLEAFGNTKILGNFNYEDVQFFLNDASFKNEPIYMDALPTISRMTSSIKLLLLTDGKLYKANVGNHSWDAIN